MFAPADTPMPDGFSSIDFDGVDLGTCWPYGRESEVHDTAACRQRLADCGMTLWRGAQGCEWSFENCLCPRCTSPDEQGNITLDDCCFVVKQQDT